MATTMESGSTETVKLLEEWDSILLGEAAQDVDTVKQIKEFNAATESAFESRNERLKTLIRTNATSMFSSHLYVSLL